MKKKITLGVSIVLAGAMLLAGCGSKPDANTAANTPAAKTGGTLNVGISSDAPKLDPAVSSSLYDRQVFASIFDKLVDLDENGKIVPMLAQEWKVSDDQKSYTFKLRQGVKFHDGTDFNAEAVKFNFDRNMDKNSTRRGELATVDKVTVVDPYTVKVDLKQPFAPFLSVLTDRAGMMVSPEAAKKAGQDFMNNPVGTGPFVYKERVKGSTITLEKNPNYWQKGLPKVDKVVYKVFNDSNVALANLKSGQVDLTDKLPAKELDNLKNDTKISVINEASYGYQGMHLNVTKAPFDKKEIRQAVDLLIDRDAIIKVAINGVAQPQHSPFAPKQFAYGDSDKAEKPNLDKAKELLAKGGKPNGFDFTLKISTSPTNALVGQMIQNMLKPAGINVNLEKVEFGTLLDQLQKGNFEAGTTGWSGRPDPDGNIYDFYVTGGSQNYAKYSNPQVDKLLNEGRGNSDEAKRKADYDSIMKILLDEVPFVYFYHEPNLIGVAKATDGFKYVPDGIIRTVNVAKK